MQHSTETNFMEWLHLNVTSRVSMGALGTWKWKWRNEGIFNNKIIDASDKFGIIRNFVREIQSAYSNASILRGSQAMYDTQWIGWSPAQLGWTTLNTNGSSRRDDSLAGEGGILKIHEGQWICSFSIKLGS